MIGLKALERLAKKHGTPLLVVDHDELRRNYATFRKYLPRVQAYFAVKALSDSAVVRTFFQAGASFDVASMPEFMLVHDRYDGSCWLWDYAHGRRFLEANDPVTAWGRLEDMLGDRGDDSDSDLS